MSWKEVLLSLIVTAILFGVFVVGMMWVYWEFFSPMKDCPNDEAHEAMTKYASRAVNSVMCFDACAKMAQVEKRTVFCRCPCATCRDILGVCIEGIYTYSYSEVNTTITSSWGEGAK
jgi:hypothetical protein